MTKHLHNLLTATGILMLCLFAALPARAYTAKDLIGNGRIAYEVLYENYSKATLMHATHGLEMKVEASELGADYIKVTNMFDGLTDLHFKIEESGSTTYAKLYTNVSFYFKSDYKNIYGQEAPGKRDGINKVSVFPVYASGAEGKYYYSKEYTYTGTVTYNSKYQIYEIAFNHALEVNGFASANADVIYDDAIMQERYGFYGLSSYEPNATISDVVYNANSSTSTSRTYDSRIVWSGNDFVIINWGGLGAAIQAETTTEAPGVTNHLAFIKGNLEEGKMYIDYDQMCMEDNSNVKLSWNFSQGYHYSGSPLIYNVRPVNSASNPTSYSRRAIEGNFTPNMNTIRHTSADLWQAPHGSLKTVADVDVVFEDYATCNDYRSDYGKKFGFRAANTKLTIPDFDVTLGVDILDGRMELGLANEADTFLTAKVPFVITKNELYTTAYEVYVIQGKISSKDDVDMEKAIKIGSVDYADAKNGEYLVEGEFTPEVNVKPGETFTDDFTFFVRAIYGREPAAASASTKRMAVALAPSHHDLTTKNFTTTTGVNGLINNSLKLENTQNGVIVHAPSDMAVEVYNMAGVKVAQGVANSEITFDGKGVFVVKAGAKVFKVVK